MAKGRSRHLWIILPLVVCINIVLNFSRGDGLLTDTDTKVALATIRQTANPWEWFVSDWPLKNHFYRPISSLAFELDNAVYGTAGWGYGLTNALLAAACVLLLFWVVREILDDWPLAAFSSAAFGFWQTSGGLDQDYLPLILYGIAGLSLLGLRHGKEKLKPVLLVFFACIFMAKFYGPIYPLFGRMIAWIPGRTASVMTVFCLAAMASYCRWERLSAPRRTPQPATATDRPLRVEGPAPRPGQSERAWIWLVCSFVCVMCAMGSYEQAIMLPAVLFGSAVLLFIRGFQTRWWVHLGYWACLVGYYLLRVNLVPSKASGYQSQQFRDGPGVWMDLIRYSVPPVENIMFLRDSWGDPMIIFTEVFWTPLISVVGALCLVWIVVKDQQKWGALAFWSLALVAFLPMAWFKMFEHYHYWSSGLRAVALALAIGAILRAFTDAVSPRERQAPPRSDPAPGSLLHQ